MALAVRTRRRLLPGSSSRPRTPASAGKERRRLGRGTRRRCSSRCRSSPHARGRCRPPPCNSAGSRRARDRTCFHRSSPRRRADTGSCSGRTCSCLRRSCRCTGRSASSRRRSSPSDRRTCRDGPDIGRTRRRRGSCRRRRCSPPKTPCTHCCSGSRSSRSSSCTSGNRGRHTPERAAVFPRRCPPKASTLLPRTRCRRGRSHRPRIRRRRTTHIPAPRRTCCSRKRERRARRPPRTGAGPRRHADRCTPPDPPATRHSERHTTCIRRGACTSHSPRRASSSG